MASTSQGESFDSTTKRRDPYEVLGIPKDAKEDQIKTAYRKMALKYHPDKNYDDPSAAEKFKEVAFSYGILSDSERRRQYDLHGFEAVDMEGFEDSLDLSSLGAFNTAVVALFSKLGVPIKTTVSATILEDAMNGTVTIRPLPVGRPVTGKVDRQQAHFFSCTLTEEQSKAGISVRVVSGPTSKFKLLYFEQEAMGGLNLLMQENCVKTAKGTSAGFYFFGFQVYRLDPSVSQIELARDREAGLFQKLENMQPCEVSEIGEGIHVFAVYGDNFFKSTPYTIEASMVKKESEEMVKLQDVETKLMKKREELRDFEREYREAVTKFLEVDARLKEEKIIVETLVNERHEIQEKFTSGAKPMRLSTITPLPGMPSILTTGPTTPPPAHVPVQNEDALGEGGSSKESSINGGSATISSRSSSFKKETQENGELGGNESTENGAEKKKWYQFTFATNKPA